MKTRIILVSIVLICAGLSAQTPLYLGYNPAIGGISMQARTKLAFNPAKGEKYTYRYVADQKTNQSFSGQDMQMNTVTEMLWELNIKEKNGNEVSFDFIYKEIVMSITNPMMSFKIDSKNKNSSASDMEKLIANVLDCVIGKTLQVVVNSDGSVKSMTGYNAMSEEMQKILSSANEMTRQMSNMLVQQAFSEESMKSSFEQTFKIYPGKDVAAGDKWSYDFSSTVANMVTQNANTYTLKSVNNDVALLDVASVTNMKASEGMTGSGEMKGESKGEIKLNAKTGMPVQSSTEGNTKGKLSMQGMEISMDITTKITLLLQ